MKICKNCRVEKSLDNFSKTKSKNKLYYQSDCNTCRNKKKELEDGYYQIGRGNMIMGTGKGGYINFEVALQKEARKYSTNINEGIENQINKSKKEYYKDLTLKDLIDFINELYKKPDNKEESKIMKNKYYRPEIEEFHIGFEYEIWETHSKLYDRNIDDSKWVSKKYDTKSIGFDKLSCRLLDVRVKYLDKEDIESLGWIDGETRGLSGFLFNPNTDDDYQMYYQFDNQFTMIYNFQAQVVFQGFIKNKSELKRIMKQLDIK